MKLTALLALVVVLLSSRPSSAQEKIELFADANRSACEVTDQTEGTVTLHVFLTGPETATLAAFRARLPDCWVGATWLTDITDYVFIGTSQGEISVAFGLCLTPPVHVAQIVVATTGAALPCCQVKIEQPISFPLLYVDCVFAEINAAVGQAVTLNPNAGCHCQLPLSTQTSTWGSVKALYR